MANTTSASLKLTVQATGENSGTWGQFTNTNLLILEQAIGGYTGVALNATTGATLTFSNGILSNGKDQVIRLTGTITSNVNVTIPDSIEKTYIVENATSGAFTVTFKTSSGTGVTWGTTDKTTKLIYSDGTNVVDSGFVDNAITEVSEDTSPQLGGDLDLDSNDITGTGNIIIAGNINTTGNIEITGTLTADNDIQADSIGVGTAPSGTTGQIRATDDITAFYSSDAMLKENITNIPDPLEALKKLNGVLFNWKDEWIKKQGGEDGYFVRKKDVGVIAQEVEKVLPEAVAQRKDGIKAVKYDRLTCLLIEAVKVLSKKVEDLTKEKK
jgi:hypothetical protein